MIPLVALVAQYNTIKPEIAAIFDPLGNAVHTALSFPVLGEDVLVTGAWAPGAVEPEAGEPGLHPAHPGGVAARCRGVDGVPAG